MADEKDFDMESALDTVSSGLGFGDGEVKDEIVEDDIVDDNAEETSLPDEEVAETDEVEETQVTARQAPKSWAKEQHETWGKIPKEAQDYIEHREKQMLDGLGEYKQYADFGRQIETVVSPYKQMFDQSGIDVNTGIKYLLNAQSILSYGTTEQKTQEIRRIAQQYGVNLGATEQQAEIDPNVKALQDQISQIQSGLTQRQQHEMQQVQAKTLSEVEAFASDAAHPYFDEVADDIVAMIKTGADLQSAYEKAVWANPVTRQKEIARINKENVTQLREKAKTEAENARKATSTNVRTRDTNKSPTEPKGKLFGDEHQAEMRAIVEKTGARA